MTTTQAKRKKIPRDLENDYTFEAATAIVAEEWVQAHDRYGRNRPQVCG